MDFYATFNPFHMLATILRGRMPMSEMGFTYYYRELSGSERLKLFLLAAYLGFVAAGFYGIGAGFDKAQVGPTIDRYSVFGTNDQAALAEKYPGITTDLEQVNSPRAAASMVFAICFGMTLPLIATMLGTMCCSTVALLMLLVACYIVWMLFEVICTLQRCFELGGGWFGLFVLAVLVGYCALAWVLARIVHRWTGLLSAPILGNPLSREEYYAAQDEMLKRLMRR